jgi:lipoprotein NlpD
MVVVAQRGLRAATVLLVATMLFASGCASGLGDAFDPNVYTVRPGDTLYSIAWRYQIDYQDLRRWNDLRDPDNIVPGQRIRLAPGGATASGRPAQPVAQAPRSSGRDGSSASEDTGPEPDGRGAVGKWRWPAAGRVIGTFSNGRVAGRGVDIAGEPGEPVQATAAGTVVYSGRGLPAYGQLIIIRHAGEYLSAYAHNEALLVEEGKRVAAGQQIARMGRSLDGEPLLHFEIRHRGRPVNPLDYLPPRD